jgi:hypothetical protein
MPGNLNPRKGGTARSLPFLRSKFSTTEIFILIYVFIDFDYLGDNLRSVKEKLQANMKLQRAEVRKIHESQRKIDEEEISDEEEEEEFDGEDEGKLSYYPKTFFFKNRKACFKFPRFMRTRVVS